MKNFTTLTKETFQIYKQKLKHILLILLIFAVVSMVLGGLLVGIVGSLMLFSSLPLFIGIIGIFSVTILWMAFIGFALAIMAVKPAGTELKEIFQEAWKKFGHYLWIVILVNIFIVLSTLFFIIPGIIVAVYLTFYSYVFVVEGEKGINALKHSWKLVKGNWWKVFGRLVLLNIVFGAIFILLDSVSSFLGSVFQFLCIPFSIIFLYLIYLELKKSKEIQAPTPIQV